MGLGSLLPQGGDDDGRLLALVLPGYTLQCIDPRTPAIPHSGAPCMQPAGAVSASACSSPAPRAWQPPTQPPLKRSPLHAALLLPHAVASAGAHAPRTTIVLQWRLSPLYELSPGVALGTLLAQFETSVREQAQLELEEGGFEAAEEAAEEAAAAARRVAEYEPTTAPDPQYEPIIRTFTRVSGWARQRGCTWRRQGPCAVLGPAASGSRNTCRLCSHVYSPPSTPPPIPPAE